MNLVCPHCKESFDEKDLLDEPSDINAKLSVLRERMCPYCEREVVLKNRFGYLDCFFWGLVLPSVTIMSWDTEWFQYVPFLIALMMFIPMKKKLHPVGDEQ